MNYLFKGSLFPLFVLLSYSHSRQLLITIKHSSVANTIHLHHQPHNISTNRSVNMFSKSWNPVTDMPNLNGKVALVKGG